MWASPLYLKNKVMLVKLFDDKLEEFIKELGKPTIAKVLRTIDLLEKFGHQLEMPHSKKIDNRLFELRVRGRLEVRIIYTFHKDTIVLLHGFIKKSQQIPGKELRAGRQKLLALDML